MQTLSFALYYICIVLLHFNSLTVGLFIQIIVHMYTVVHKNSAVSFFD